MLIVDRIHFILEQRGMRQKDLADLLDKKKEADISKWMRGTHDFTIDTVSQIEQALGEKTIIKVVGVSMA